MAEEVKLLLSQYDIEVLATDGTYERAAKSNRWLVATLVHHLFTKQELVTRRVNKRPRLNPKKLEMIIRMFKTWLKSQGYPLPEMVQEMRRLKYYIKKEVHEQKAIDLYWRKQAGTVSSDEEFQDTYEESSSEDDSPDSDEESNADFSDVFTISDVPSDCSDEQ